MHDARELDARQQQTRDKREPRETETGETAHARTRAHAHERGVIEGTSARIERHDRTRARHERT